MITLYGYWRSSAAYRVRIALNLKKILHGHQSIHLVKNGGEQHQPSYTELNPAHLVPTLIDGERVISQSMAIIEYINEQYGGISLLPGDAYDKAIVRSLAQSIACEVHPLNNLRVLQHLEQHHEFSKDDKTQWMNHWMGTGFSALEKQLERYSGQYCFGDQVSLADLCLIPQLYNARRFGIVLDAYPNILKVEANCLALESFKSAAPEAQADAQP